MPTPLRPGDVASDQNSTNLHKYSMACWASIVPLAIVAIAVNGVVGRIQEPKRLIALAQELNVEGEKEVAWKEINDEIETARKAPPAEEMKSTENLTESRFYSGETQPLGPVVSVGVKGDSYEIMYRSGKDCKIAKIPNTSTHPSTPPQLGDILGKTPDGSVEIIGRGPIIRCPRDESPTPTATHHR